LDYLWIIYGLYMDYMDYLWIMMMIFLNEVPMKQKQHIYLVGGFNPSEKY
jgi:hypothetical protein